MAGPVAAVTVRHIKMPATYLGTVDLTIVPGNGTGTGTGKASNGATVRYIKDHRLKFVKIHLLLILNMSNTVHIQCEQYCSY